MKPSIPVARHRSTGFTLIELMVVVAIVAVLMAIAIPSYLQYVRRAHRSEAMDALLMIASEQERFLFRFGRYAGRVAAAPTSDPLTAGLGLAEATAHYDIALSLGDDALSYRLSAAPRDDQVQDPCGVLRIDHVGTRDADGERCW